MADGFDVDEMITRFRERAAAVKRRPLPPVAGDERAHFVRQAQVDYRDFAIIGDATGSFEDGVLVLRIDLRPAEDFAVGHIEGSGHVDIYGVSLSDSSEAPLQAFLTLFRTLFGSRGVSLDKPVVIYDHESGERASRAVWLLR